MAQCNFPWEQDSMVLQSTKDINMFEQPPISNQEVEVSSRNGSPMDNISINELQGKLFSANEFSPQNSSNHFQHWIPSMTEAVNLNLPVDLSSDEIRLCGSSQNIFGNFRQQPNSAEDGHRSDIFFEGSNYDTILAESEYKEIVPQQKSHVTSASNLNSSTGASSVTMEFGRDKDSIKHDMGMADSRSDCSDQIEDDDDVNVGRRSGRRNQCKNLMAERKRRKKLNERLYQLRALVPKITKMDKASILGDAIQFVKDLQKQAKDLQDELEERSDRDNAKNNGSVETLNHNGVNHGTNPNMDEAINGLQMGVMEKGIGASSNTGMADPNHDLATKHERTQQMEVQVKVAPIDGNEFFLKVFCEHKRGGFARLMEALCSLGLEVTDANITTFRGLVLNNFTVEKKDSEMIQAEQVRESLLELTSMSEPFQVSMMGGDLDYQPPHNHSQQHHYHH